MECRWCCLLGAERGCVGVCMVCEWNGKAGGAVYHVSADTACMCVCVCVGGGDHGSMNGTAGVLLLG